MEESVHPWLFDGRFVNCCISHFGPLTSQVKFIGVIAQQLLLLPHHPTRPTPLPFMITHLLLVGTRSVVLKDPSTGLRYTPPANTQRTVAERIEAAKRVVLLTLDPSWIKDNGTRLEALLERIIAGG